MKIINFPNKVQGWQTWLSCKGGRKYNIEDKFLCKIGRTSENCRRREEDSRRRDEDKQGSLRVLPPGTRRPQLSLAAGRLPPDPSPSLWGFPPEIFGFLPKYFWISSWKFLYFPPLGNNEEAAAVACCRPAPHPSLPPCWSPPPSLSLLQALCLLEGSRRAVRRWIGWGSELHLCIGWGGGEPHLWWQLGHLWRQNPIHGRKVRDPTNKGSGDIVQYRREKPLWKNKVDKVLERICWQKQFFWVVDMRRWE